MKIRMPESNKNAKAGMLIFFSFLLQVIYIWKSGALYSQVGSFHFLGLTSYLLLLAALWILFLKGRHHKDDSNE